MSTYKVVLYKSDQGYAISCPALRGCHSQGKTREEALENIRIAIKEWIEAEQDVDAAFSVDEVEVTV